jgi:hypothetical protein
VRNCVAQQCDAWIHLNRRSMTLVEGSDQHAKGIPRRQRIQRNALV